MKYEVGTVKYVELGMTYVSRGWHEENGGLEQHGGCRIK